MKWISNNKKMLNTVAIILIVSLLISIVPIIISSFYSHPIADDFGFSHKVHNIIQKGGGFFDVLSASFQQVKDTYLNWQGTYAAIFIFSLQPGAFNENFYFLTTIVMLTSLIASTLYFINTVFKVLNFNRMYGLIISSIILLLSIQFVIDKKEAFFWWNGCSYYTIFYSLSLLLFSLLVKMTFSEKTTAKVNYLIPSLVLAATIGGGNYSSALLSTVIIAIAIVIAIKTKSKILPYYSAVFFVLLTGLIISILAPGNSVRAVVVTSESPILAIFHSIFYALLYITKWTGLSQIAGFIVIAFLAFILTKNTKHQYKYPLLVFIISVLVFATQFTPPLYAMSSVGSGRQINIYYYSYYLLMTFNIFYFCGWINFKKTVIIRTQDVKKTYLLCSLLMVIFVFIGGCFNYGIYNLTFVDTVLELKNGVPQTYNMEYMDRIDSIKTGNTTIKDIDTVPDFFSKLNIKEDSGFWINKQIARYYDVEKITLKN